MITFVFAIAEQVSLFQNGSDQVVSSFNRRYSWNAFITQRAETFFRSSTLQNGSGHDLGLLRKLLNLISFLIQFVVSAASCLVSFLEYGFDAVGGARRQIFQAALTAGAGSTFLQNGRNGSGNALVWAGVSQA